MNAPLNRPSGVPLDALEFDNRYAALPAAFHTRLPPSSLPAPHRVVVSEDAAALIGLDVAQTMRPDFVDAFAGNALLRGSEPLAAVYGGHQFGSWSGRLGDGRAHLLGGVRTSSGTLELQLKGAGPTPYSRFSDGRAVLRSSIREFLCSEAMAALGIPTTRALCVIGSSLPVQRETMETAAVLTRIAPTFVRFGSFEYFADKDDVASLRTLADHVIDGFLPHLRDAPKPFEALLAEAARCTGELIAHWQAIGFMHGVMNTDNMSILGLTLDYGPFGFMEAFDAGHICNHSDTYGRYAFRAQPRIGLWNLYALADALGPLIGHPDVTRALADDHYTPAFDAHFAQRMRGRLGLATAQPGDADFIGATLGLLQLQRIDYTLFFRALSGLPGAVLREARAVIDAPLRDLFADREACDAWLLGWRARLAREGSRDAVRKPAMRAVNPRYVLRNWMAEAAIRRAREGDFGEVRAVFDCLRRPFDDQPASARYAAPPPDWAAGMSVSCSS
ncbi:YdiU family protein [Methyloversatilis sp.]|uniref:protein adenylyltransferase SelO n=1 Tax=Methyloversatilis sp. TaxID=2569862 RepID=UPI002735DA61|nr:YdiU family protein [Methyloversatilis sp.]MDP2870752.1 YdiU family protein [Methyloversatilis sp.]MDP3455555.1 YdiU family protein [Methyloversatilis sp.]MDP3578170.1 YdiU family protein [Methyloversatilis sp.]